MREVRKRHHGAKQEDTPKNKPTESQPTKQPSRWRNWWIRGLLTLTMLVIFYFIVSAGPLALTLMVFLLQLKIFHEILSIGHQKWPKELPWFRSLNWYFLFAANYYFYGHNFEYLLAVEFTECPTVLRLLRHHQFVSFSLYIVGFCTFVLSLRKGFYKVQFTQFGWTHVSALLIVTTAQLIILSIYKGLIWFLLPASMVICNDIMAYMFGFFFGKTPLIALSPKKTWEGFAGGFLSTIVFGMGFAYILSSRTFFTCPFESLSIHERTPPPCVPAAVFQWSSMNLNEYAPSIVKLTGFEVVPVLPIMFHAVVMSIFASLIAPFGGFFASGLKRAFKLKDFDDLIPGHGGLVDRFDCQFVMAFFAYVYHESFLRSFRVEELVRAVSSLSPEERQEFVEMVNERFGQ